MGYISDINRVDGGWSFRLNRNIKYNIDVHFDWTSDGMQIVFYGILQGLHGVADWVINKDDSAIPPDSHGHQVLHDAQPTWTDDVLIVDLERSIGGNWNIMDPFDVGVHNPDDPNAGSWNQVVFTFGWVNPVTRKTRQRQQGGSVTITAAEKKPRA